MKILSAENIVEGPISRAVAARTIGLCFILMVCDCFDILALAVAARSLISLWGLSSSTMGLLLSIGTFGLLVGSIGFGWFGDRFGRRNAIILGSLLFSVLTGAMGFADSASEMAILRFFAGIGLGGAIPNAVAVVSENAPKRVAVTSVGIIYAGYALGGILVGIAASLILPEWGWQWLFFLGGAVSLLVAIAFIFLLPESLPFLASQPSRQAEAVALARKLRPDLQFSDIQISATSGRHKKGDVREIFKGHLRLITPLLWVAYIASSMTASFLASWLPAATEAMGLSQRLAPLAFSLLFLGSAIGGIIGGRFVDRLGSQALTPLALVAFPATAGLGLVSGPPALVLVLSLVVGVLTFGCQTSVIGVVGTFYPTSLKATGVGWAAAIAKLGAMAGSYAGGVLMSHVDTAAFFFCGATPLLVVAATAWVLNVINLRASARSLGG